MYYYTVYRISRVFFLLVLVALSAKAQPQPRIDNIRPVAHNDTITISYDLIGAQPGQQFRIKAFCWNGFREIPLKAIDGHTLVGRGQQQLDWYVLKDLDLLVGDSITFTLAAYPPDDVPVTPTDRKMAVFTRITQQVDAYLEETYNHTKPFSDFGEHLYEHRHQYNELLRKLEKWNKMHDTLLVNRRKLEASIGTLWGDEAKAATETFFQDLFDRKHRNLRDEYNKLYKRIKDGADGHYEGKSRNEFIEELKADIFLLTQKHILPQLDDLKAHADKLYKQLPL